MFYANFVAKWSYISSAQLILMVCIWLWLHRLGLEFYLTLNSDSKLMTHQKPEYELQEANRRNMADSGVQMRWADQSVCAPGEKTRLVQHDWEPSFIEQHWLSFFTSVVLLISYIFNGLTHLLIHCLPEHIGWMCVSCYPPCVNNILGCFLH